MVLEGKSQEEMRQAMESDFQATSKFNNEVGAKFLAAFGPDIAFDFIRWKPLE
jgi:hypothetical protein